MTEGEALLAELLAQEERLQLPRFDHEDAFRIGMMLVERARADSMPLTIQITRVHQVLFQTAMPGTVLDNDHWVRRKTATVYRFGHSSFYMGVSCRVRGVTLAERYDVDPGEFAAHGGAFPIRVRGVGLVGVAAVSGLPQEEDHRLLVGTLDGFLAQG
ncbi:MAG: heme-degrading domain-containing protein [Geminicoccaceae bacterium]